MSYEEFKERGYYVYPHAPDYKGKPGMRSFYEDPENNPLQTPSGKLEIFSTWIFEKYGAEDPEIPPVPHYIPEWEGIESKDLLAKYPLHLLGPHPKFRF